MRLLYPAPIIMLAVLALNGCSATPGADAPRGGFAPTTRSATLVPNAFLHVHRIVIAPLEVAVDASAAQPQWSSPGADMSARSAEEDALQKRFEGIADEVLSFELISGDKLVSAKPGQSQSIRDTTTVDRWRAAAGSHGADAILIGRLNQYKQRQGSAVGSESPARVDLECSLVRVSDGVTLWQGSYHYEDEALLDNLLRVRQKLGNTGAPSWYSAEAVFRSGAHELLRRLEKERGSVFFPAGKQP